MARQYESPGMRHKLRPVVIGLTAGIVVSALLLFLFSILIMRQDTPQRLIEPLAIASLSVGAFFTGLACTRITRRGGLVYGMLCGLLLSGIVLLAGMIAGVGGVGASGIFRVIFITLCSMIGGVMGANARRRR